MPARIAKFGVKAAKWIELSGRVTVRGCRVLRGLNKEDPYGPAEGFVDLFQLPT